MGKMAVGSGHGTENMQLAGKRRPLLVDGVPQLLILQQGLLGKDAQLFAGFREGDGAVIAHEQRLAEVFLKALDLARKRGRADVHRPGAAAKVTAFRRCRNIFRSRKSTDSTHSFYIA